MPDTNQYIDEERVIALTLSVKFWGAVAQSPKATPPKEQQLFETADRIYQWLTR